MSFLLLFGGGSCLAALQVSFHVLTLENTEVSYFFISFFFTYTPYMKFINLSAP